MLYSNKFITMELTEGFKNESESTIRVKITRNDPNYSNQKGWVVIIQPHNTGEETVKEIWYSEFGSENPTKPYEYDSDTVPVVISNTYEKSEMLIVPSILGGKKLRQGRLRVNVYVKENKPKAESFTMLGGNIVITTTPIRLPQANILQTNFFKMDNKFYLRLKTEGLNPHNFYDQNIEVEGMDLSVPVHQVYANKLIIQEIPEELYRKRVDVAFEFLLNDQVLHAIYKKFNMPMNGVKMYVKDGDKMRKVKVAWVNTGTEWREAHRVHLKDFGYFITKG